MSYTAISSSPHYQLVNAFSRKPVIESILIIQWGSNPNEASVSQIKADKPMMHVESTPA
nr:hypothetical protein [Moraxella osloensis]